VLKWVEKVSRSEERSYDLIQHNAITNNLLLVASLIAVGCESYSQSVNDESIDVSKVSMAYRILTPPSSITGGVMSDSGDDTSLPGDRRRSR